MTKPKNSPLPRRRTGRAAVLAGATFVLTLSANPGAYADSDTGLPGAVTQVIGQATQPVVPPVVESVQAAVPQPVQEVVEPVQEAVEPVVEQVVEPVRPVVQVVEQVAHSSGPADEPPDDPAGASSGSSVQVPVGHVGPGTAGAAGIEVTQPAAHTVAQHAPGGTATSGGHAGAGHAHAFGPAATSCPDLPPRAVSSVVAHHGGDHEPPSDHWAVWDLTNALMRLSAASDGGSPGEVVPPRQEASDRRAAGLPRQMWRTVPALDLPSPDPELGLLELLGIGLLVLLGGLAAGVLLAGSRARG